jgi:hypothetical protein
MTQRTAAGRKTDPFEELLLAEAQFCHDEMLMSREGIRANNQLLHDKKVNYYDAVEARQRELSNISRCIADTTMLARAAARLRGQNIHVTRVAKERENGGGGGGDENANSIPQENVAANDGAQVAAE